MKTIIHFLSFVFILSVEVQSQNICDFFKTDSVTWYGIDFTRAKFAGPGFNNPQEIKNTYLKAWNILILNEPEKFNLWYFFDKSYVDFNLDPVLKRNSTIDENNLVSYNLSAHPINPAVVDSVITEYNFQKNSGFGLLLMVESFNNYEEKAYFQIVIIDLKTKKVLLTKQLSGSAHGIGLRNFWAGSIYGALFNLPLMSWKKELCVTKKK